MALTKPSYPIKPIKPDEPASLFRFLALVAKLSYRNDMQRYIDKGGFVHCSNGITHRDISIPGEPHG